MFLDDIPLLPSFLVLLGGVKNKKAGKTRNILSE
jgi:hypothetical protein